MTIKGYNFNSSSSNSELLARGYYSIYKGSITTTSVLSWNLRSWGAANYSYLRFPPLTSAVTLIRAKTCVNIGSLLKTNRVLEFLDSDGSDQISILVNSVGNIVLYLGTSTILETYETNIVSGVSNNFEAIVYFDSTNGYVKTYLNGSLLGTYTGNTIKTSNTSAQIVGVYLDDSSSYIHDAIIDDDPTDTILGNCYAKTRKIASVSSNTGFAAVGDETDIPTILNQTSPDGTDYIEASADGDTITLALEPGDEDDTDVRALCITALVQKNGDGDCNGTLTATVNGTDTASDETALANGYTGLTVNVTGGLTSAYADAATITLTRSE